MTVESEIYSRLKDYAGMSAAVSTRIYPTFNNEQNPVAPFIIYQKISSKPTHSFGVNNGVYADRFQIDIYASVFYGVATSACSIRDLVVAAMDRYRGGIIQDILIDNEQHL